MTGQAGKHRYDVGFRSTISESIPKRMVRRAIETTLTMNKVSSYTCSVAFVGAMRMRTLNRRHRHKDYPTTILSYALTDTMGELILSPDRIRQSARRADVSYNQHLSDLVVHGTLHLLGFTHDRPPAATDMEKKEKRIRARLNTKGEQSSG